MADTYFQCPTINCAYAIALTDLNKVQLQALRRWVKTCPECNQQGRFLEQTSLPNIQTNKPKSYGGTSNEKTTHNRNGDLPKTASQKRKAARHDGRH